MVNSFITRARASAGVWKINGFMRTGWYIALIAALCVLSSLLGLELIVYPIYILIAVFLCLFGMDLLPLIPIVICSYVSPSVVNNPGRNPESIFYPAHGGIFLIILGAVLAVSLIWRLITDPDFGGKKFLTCKRSLTLGMVTLGVAYLLGGLGMDRYLEYAGDTILFGFIQFASVLVMYFLFTGAVHWKKAPKDYLAWVGLCVGFVILAQLAENYLSGRMFMEGTNTIDRELMATGWGMHNNVGGMMAMMLPFPFYLAYKRRNSWWLIALASVLMLGVIASCSRTAMFIGAAEFVVCSLILLRRKDLRLPILIVYGVAVVAVGVFAIVSFDALLEIFALFIEEINAISKRDLLLINGLKQFRQYPIFGGSFYPQGEFVPWDWANLEAFSSFFPPRWHCTLVQIAASCGIVGLAAYVFHRVQTVRMMLRRLTVEKVFIGLYILALLAASLLDNHFFNVGPVLMYSMALAFAEKIEISEV